MGLPPRHTCVHVYVYVCARVQMTSLSNLEMKRLRWDGSPWTKPVPPVESTSRLAQLMAGVTCPDHNPDAAAREKVLTVAYNALRAIYTLAVRSVVTVPLCDPAVELLRAAADCEDLDINYVVDTCDMGVSPWEDVPVGEVLFPLLLHVSSTGVDADDADDIAHELATGVEREICRVDLLKVPPLPSYPAGMPFRIKLAYRPEAPSRPAYNLECPYLLSHIRRSFLTSDEKKEASFMAMTFFYKPKDTTATRPARRDPSSMFRSLLLPPPATPAPASIPTPGAADPTDIDPTASK